MAGSNPKQFVHVSLLTTFILVRQYYDMIFGEKTLFWQLDGFKLFLLTFTITTGNS